MPEFTDIQNYKNSQIMTGSQKFAKVQQDAKLLLPTLSLLASDVDQALYHAVLTKMKNDKISHISKKGQSDCPRWSKKMRTMFHKEYYEARVKMRTVVCKTTLTPPNSTGYSYC